MPLPLFYSDHALRRIAQRGLSMEDVEYVVANGRRIHAAGVIQCFLAKRDIPKRDLKNDKFARLEGTVVLLVRSSWARLVVITVYRNRKGLRKIRVKAKYARSRGPDRNLPLAG